MHIWVTTIYYKWFHACVQRCCTCPSCGEANKRAINSLKIYCPNRSKDCDKITILGECNQHLKKCLFVEVSCTKNCGERMLQKELPRSRGQQVPKPSSTMSALHTIEGMHKEITAKSHLDECVGFPVSCPNNCGQEKIQRNNLADHQKVCPLQPVKCPFLEAGCTKMIPRKDLVVHKASNTCSTTWS